MDTVVVMNRWDPAATLNTVGSVFFINSYLTNYWKIVFVSLWI